MSDYVLKPSGAEININTVANSCGNAYLVRVVNPGVAAVLNWQYANGNVYANCTVANTESVIVQKATTDLLVGNGMFAVAVTTSAHTAH